MLVLQQIIIILKSPIFLHVIFQMSSRLLSCAGANALLMLPPRSAERHELPPGHEVDAMIIAPLRRGQKEDGEMRV